MNQMFYEGLNVQYRNLYGMIDFICEDYVVMRVDVSLPERFPPRLIIPPCRYDEIHIAKESTR